MKGLVRNNVLCESRGYPDGWGAGLFTVTAVPATQPWIDPSFCTYREQRGPQRTAIRYLSSSPLHPCFMVLWPSLPAGPLELHRHTPGCFSTVPGPHHCPAIPLSQAVWPASLHLLASPAVSLLWRYKPFTKFTAFFSEVLEGSRTHKCVPSSSIIIN